MMVDDNSVSKKIAAIKEKVLVVRKIFSPPSYLEQMEKIDKEIDELLLTVNGDEEWCYPVAWNGEERRKNGNSD